MAYLEFALPGGGGAGIFASVTDTPKKTAARFSALEWSVIALAERDGLASLAEPGRISAAMGALFGFRTDSPRLADQRLEALRRAVVLIRHKSGPLSPDGATDFLMAGFVPAQLDLLTKTLSAQEATA